MDDWLNTCLTKGSADKAVFTFLNERGAETSRLTYAQLEQQTRSLSHALLTGSASRPALAPGDRVLLVYLPSLDFIVAFIACLRVGLVAVPTYPPDPQRSKSNFGAFAKIARDCGAKVALTHKPYSQLVSLAGLQDAATRIFSVFSRTADGAPALQWPDWLVWVATDGLVSGATATRDAPSRGGSETAFLQYTSGSTAEPKGVMISYSNLHANLVAITRSLHAKDDTVVVSWLPQYHDMGLIGSYLGVLFCGGSGVYFSPLSFIKRPVLWVEAISRYHATHVQSPNFGLKLTARKWAEEIAEGTQARTGPPLDLSSLRHIFNAAEPVTLAAMRDFMQAFKSLGLQPQALRPGYGLAEHTVYVSDGGSVVLRVNTAAYERDGRIVVEGQEDLVDAVCSSSEVAASQGVTELVSCGPVASLEASVRDAKNAEIVVVIVDPETCVALPDDSVGEVWVNSPSKAQGYWGNAGLTVASFEAQLALKPQQHLPETTATSAQEASVAPGIAAVSARAINALPMQGFLRTGDRGFLHGGELFISGRIKDLIIVRGRNHYPQDIEQAVETVAEVRPGCVAAFQAPIPARGSDEGVVVVAELRSPTALSQAELQRISAGVRSAIMQHQAVSIDALLFLRPHCARKTTSGKIARSWNRRAFIELLAQDASSPWLVRQSGPAPVLHLWMSEQTPGLADDDAGDERSIGGSTAATTAADDSSGPPRAPSLRPGTASEAFEALEGQALLLALQSEVAALLRVDSGSIDAVAPLQDLGLDSLSVAQLGGALTHKYGLCGLRDELLFSDGATLSWIVQNAAQLRIREGPAIPAPVISSRDPPHSGGVTPGHASSGGTMPTDAAKDSPNLAGDVAGPRTVEEVNTAMMMAGRRPGAQPGPPSGAGRRRPGWFEQNCPCCMWCC